MAERIVGRSAPLSPPPPSPAEVVDRCVGGTRTAENDEIALMISAEPTRYASTGEAEYKKPDAAGPMMPADVHTVEYRAII